VAAFRAFLVALQPFALFNQPAHNTVMNFQRLVSMLRQNGYFALAFRGSVKMMGSGLESATGLRVSALTGLPILKDLVRGCSVHLVRGVGFEPGRVR
jgi:hypothetical protein